jgi:hypothetical protein
MYFAFVQIKASRKRLNNRHVEVKRANFFPQWLGSVSEQYILCSGTQSASGYTFIPVLGLFSARYHSNRVPEMDEVAGGWGRLHSEDIHNLYASTYIIRVKK